MSVVTPLHHADPKAPRRVSKKSGRWYDVDGTDYVSVTNVTGVIDKSGPLVGWATNLEREHCVDTAANFYRRGITLPPLDDAAFRQSLRAELGTMAHKRTSARARGIGDEAHDAIERWAFHKLGRPTKPPKPLSEAAMTAFMSFEDWAKGADLTPIAAEVVLYSDQYKYAGTCDLVATVNGHLAILDWKTSKRIYTKDLLQSAAYQVAWTEMGHRKPEGAFVVRLPKDLDAESLEVEVVTVPPVEELWPGFEACLTLWKFLHARGG